MNGAGALGDEHPRNAWVEPIVWLARHQFRSNNVSQGDPTDNALAAIASILDKSDSPEHRGAHDAPEILADIHIETPAGDAESYSRAGPGPLDAIRFKWTARRDDNGDYFVDETIGANSRPIISGPMTREAAVKLVDERQRDARTRFERLRSEMAGGEIGRSDQPDS